MINKTFEAVAIALQKLANKFKITYNEINIIVYYLLIPLSWTLILDFKIHLFILTPLFLAFWLGFVAGTWKHFSEFSDNLFDKSVKFLLWFPWGYVKSSVIICVILPILI